MDRIRGDIFARVRIRMGAGRPRAKDRPRQKTWHEINVHVRLRAGVGAMQSY